MSKNKLLRFYEYEKVCFLDEFPIVNSSEQDVFSFEKKHIQALSSFHQKGGSFYYSLEHQAIKFKHFVGAIQIHDLTIEILPKIDRPNQFAEEDKGSWHSFLLDMLKECKLLKPKSFQTASLKLRANSILDLYIELYISELEYLLHTGLIKKYKKIEGNKNALKGTLLFNKQIQHNLIHAERFYIRHTIYNKEHLLHQILRQALILCSQITTSNSLNDRINRLLLDWPESKQVAIYPAVFKKFKSDRKTAPYLEALGIAKLLLLNQNPEIRGGGEHVLALMFDMNKLWEEFIYRRLKSCESDLDFKVFPQTQVDFWSSESEYVLKKVKPDLIIQFSGKSLVIDTKWKRPDDAHPADDDLKQMLVYKLYYHANQAILLYPHHSSNFVTKGNFKNEVHHTASDYGYTALKKELELDCGMAFLNVRNGSKILDIEKFKIAINEILKIK